jgi:hypothetical protein
MYRLTIVKRDFGQLFVFVYYTLIQRIASI